MKAKIVDGHLTFELSDLISSMSKEDVAALARQLVADEYLFADVLETVSTGSCNDGEWWFSDDTVLKLREKLIPLMPDIARQAVESALAQRNSAQEDKERYMKWAFALSHAWPDEHYHLRPKGLESWKPATPPSKAEIDAAMVAPSQQQSETKETT